jgi:Ras-related C3 botulinum toxin substrate 1
MAQVIKCVVVGDGAVGKTSVLLSYTTNSVPSDYVPTVFDNYMVPIMYHNRPYSLSLWDTAGQEDYDRLRPLSYPGTDVFIVCFSLDNPESLAHVESKWMPEIKHFSREVPIVLVGTKSDLKNTSKCLVDPSSIQIVMEKVKPSDYVECSAISQWNIKHLFETSLRHAIATRTFVT